MRRGAALGTALVVSVVMSTASTARAASLALSAAEKQEALRLGERSVTQETFGAEWRVEKGNGESVTVMTPFHRLALAARHAAFRGEPLKPGEPDRMLSEQGERLVLLVELHGARPDFARLLKPELSVGDRTIAPALVQNEHTPLHRDGTYVARCVYTFPTKGLAGTSPVVLVVRDADGHEVSRFPIALAKMR